MLFQHAYREPSLRDTDALPPVQPGDTDFHKPEKHQIRACANDFIFSKLTAVMDKSDTQRLLTVRAITSVKTLRDKSVAWMQLAVNRLEIKEEDGRNIIERAIDRLYFAPARSPEMQVEASAWYAARRMQVAAGVVAARIVGRKAAAAAAAATAIAESGVDAAAVAAAVTTACETYDTLHEIVQVAGNAKLSPGDFDPLAVPGGLLDALAAHEQAYQVSRIPTAPANINEGGKRRPGKGKRGVSAAEIAGAARAVDEAAEILARTVDDIVNGDSTEDDEDDVIAEAPAVKSRKRKVQPSSHKPVTKVAARATPAVVAASSAEATAPSQDVDDDDEGDESGDDNRFRPTQASSRRRVVGDTAAPREGRSKEENKIPRLWAQLQDAATRGRIECFASRWSVVFTATRVVIESLLEGDDNDVARALSWEKALMGMQNAYDLGGADIAAYSVI